MKPIKKTIFAALILAVMGIFATRATSDATINGLFDQNVEALALEDPRHPNGSGDTGVLDDGEYSGGAVYYPGGGATITCDAHQQVFSAQCWRFQTEADGFSGRNCHFICFFTGKAADHCSTLWAVASSFFAYCAEY